MNQFHSNRFLCAVLSIILVLSLTGCGAKEQEQEEIVIDESVSGEVLTGGNFKDNVFSLAVDFKKSLNPLKTTSSASLRISGLVFDNFFDVDTSYNLTSRICTDWRVNDEGNFWTFVVDDTIQMHDGTTLTAYDVAYSLNRALMYSNYFKSRMSNVSGVSAYSNTELCISTRHPDTQLPYELVVPVIKYGGITSDAPVGSGPYMFAYPQTASVASENDSSESTDGDEGTKEEITVNPDRLVAFAGYSGGSIPVNEIYLREYVDPASNIEDYESGLVDLVVNDPTGVYNMGYGGRNERRIYTTNHMQYIGFSKYSKYFCYNQFRQAMTYIIDRATIASDIMDNYADPAELPINPASPLYDQSLANSLAYDKQRCISLLAQAGCADLDGDGEMEFSLSGSKMEFTIKFIVCADSANKVSAARHIAEEMQSIGLPVTLYELSWKDYQNTLFTPRDEEDNNAPTFDMYYDEVVLTGDWDITDFFAEVDEETVSYYGTLNYGRWNLDSLNNAIAVYLSTPNADTGALAENCRSMCVSLAENAVIIPVCFEKQVVFSHIGVIRGMNPNQYNVFYNIGDWSINLK